MLDIIFDWLKIYSTYSIARILRTPGRGIVSTYYPIASSNQINILVLNFRQISLFSNIIIGRDIIVYYITYRLYIKVIVLSGSADITSSTPEVTLDRWRILKEQFTALSMQNR